MAATRVFHPGRSGMASAASTIASRSWGGAVCGSVVWCGVVWCEGGGWSEEGGPRQSIDRSHDRPATQGRTDLGLLLLLLLLLVDAELLQRPLQLVL